MSLPQWVTPAGHIGTVSELEYYQYRLSTTSLSGGQLVYSLISGKLPLGLQIDPSGLIQGIPVSEVGSGTGTNSYRFTVRVKNIDTNELADRSFSISIVDVSPPVVLPRYVDMGTVLDGTIVDIQLVANEALPGATLTWSVLQGELPPGIELTSSGHLIGYLRPIPQPTFGTAPGWDSSPWNYVGWEYTSRAIAKAFAFTVQVYNGVNTGTADYKIYVFPRSFLTADNNIFTTQTQYLGGGTGHKIPYTIDIGNRHSPIIVTEQSDFVAIRQGSYFSFKIDAFDLDEDQLQYYIPELQAGGFDEQSVTFGNVTYVVDDVVDNILSVHIDTNTEYITPYLPGSSIKFLGASGHWQDGTISNHADLVVSGNVALTASVANYVTQDISGANAIIEAISSTTSSLIVSGTETIGNIRVTGTYPNGTLTVSVPVTANIGNYVTQLISGANATVTANVVNSTEIPISQPLIQFFNGAGDVSINGGVTSSHPISTVYNTVFITANVGNYITQTSSGANAIVTHQVIGSQLAQVKFLSGTFNTTGNISVNGSPLLAKPVEINQTVRSLPLFGEVGNYITQPSSGANAIIISHFSAGTTVPVQYISGVFDLVGNLLVNGVSANVHPISAVRNTTLSVIYETGSPVFDLAATDPLQMANINGISSSYPTTITSVGIIPGDISIEGVGFGMTAFDQGALLLPPGLSIDINTGWITGPIPYQSINQVDYSFTALVNKKEYKGYDVTKTFTLTVLGDLNNRINWITPTDLGTIENGMISDLSVNAVSTKGKVLFYNLVSGSASRIPQGLQLNSDGLLIGRVSFELFSFDKNTTTFDDGLTLFDNVYTFTVIASDNDKTIAAEKTFKLRVIKRTATPYENLYLTAMLSSEQRQEIQDIFLNKSIFPASLIYRRSDPNFGVSSKIRTLFLPGLAPSTLAEYVDAASTNHFTKRLLFGNIKTAVARDANFNIKYEVVYVEMKDETEGLSAEDVIDMTSQITPYYDATLNAYTVAYPNSFINMKNKMVTLDYANKGALPDWMTSRQPDGRILGFTQATVLAYTEPGASALVAFRFSQAGYNLNKFDFTVDRYTLDNHFSDNFNVAENSFVPSAETTFDRYIRPGSVFTESGVVDFAVTNLSFEDINNRSLEYITQIGGINGVSRIRHGQTLVFFNQEFHNSQYDIGYYDVGWAEAIALWDREPWAYDASQVDAIDPQKWDESSYVPGYYEHIENPSVENKRIGIWQVELLAGGVVHLVFVRTLNFYDTLTVLNGEITANIFYDPTVKPGFNVPSFSVIPQQIKTEYVTIFDGNSTRFHNNRDTYSLPGTGDKFIIWKHKTVFN